MKRKYGVVSLFLGAAVLSAVAGLVPLLRHQAANVTFVVLTGVWLVLAVVVAFARGRGAAGERV